MTFNFYDIGVFVISALIGLLVCLAIVSYLMDIFQSFAPDPLQEDLFRLENDYNSLWSWSHDLSQELVEARASAWRLNERLEKLEAK